MDATGSHADSLIPANASADTGFDTNINLISAIPHNAYSISAPLQQGTQQPRPNAEDMSVIQESLDNLYLDKNHTTVNGELHPQNGTSDTYASGEKVPTNVLGNPAAPPVVGVSNPRIVEKENSVLTSFSCRAQLLVSQRVRLP